MSISQEPLGEVGGHTKVLTPILVQGDSERRSRVCTGPLVPTSHPCPKALMQMHSLQGRKHWVPPDRHRGEVPGSSGCCTPSASTPRAQAVSCHHPRHPHPAWPPTHSSGDGLAPSANISCRGIAAAVFALFIFLTLFVSYLSTGGWGTVSIGAGLSTSPC